MAEPLTVEPEDAVDSGGPATLPAEYSQAWPVPWKPVWGPRDGLGARLETWLARGTLGLLARCPEPVLAPVLGGIARLARRCDRRHAASARKFLTTALGELPRHELEAHVLQAYRHFLRVMVESVQANRLSLAELRERIEVVYCDEALRVLGAKKGCVLVSAHVGNWEVGVAAAPMAGFDPFYGVAKPVRNRPLSKLLQRDRERRGVRVLPRRGAMTAAPTILRAGGVLGLLLDQRARVKPALAPFFGRLARCDRSAAVLVRRLRAPVVFCGCYRAEKPLTFRLEFTEVLRAEDLAGQSPEEVTARVNAALERLILRAPEQYFWLHDRYKDTPREAAASPSPAVPGAGD